MLLPRSTILDSLPRGALLFLALAQFATATGSAKRRLGRVEVVVERMSEMVQVPSGSFEMGMPATVKEQEAVRAMCREDYASSAEVCLQEDVWKSAMPSRRVHLADFAIDRHEVQVSEYRECVRAGACDVGALLFGDQRYNKSDWPMVNVSWDDAGSYCKWRGKRLPTEAEWEKAARGSESLRWPWGGRWQAGSANHGRLADETILSLKNANQNGMRVLEAYEPDKTDGHTYAAPPGSMVWGDSPYGAADMAGNVREWVQDYFASEGYEDLSLVNPVRDTPLALETRRVIRGGAWTEPRLLTISYLRFSNPHMWRAIDIGFRCALVPALDDF